jgi:hypothetical protein
MVRYILAHLTSVCRGNIHEKGVVTIASSGNMYHKCYQVADHGGMIIGTRRTFQIHGFNLISKIRRFR